MSRHNTEHGRKQNRALHDQPVNPSHPYVHLLHHDPKFVQVNVKVRPALLAGLNRHLYSPRDYAIIETDSLHPFTHLGGTLAYGNERASSFLEDPSQAVGLLFI